MEGKIILKSSREIEIMEQAGSIAGYVLSEMQKQAKPGMTTQELDQFAEDIISEQGGIPSFKNFKGYPAATCISLNSEIVHGIPSEKRLQDGDLVGIDIGVLFKGYHSDTAISFVVGKSNPEKDKLLEITKLALDKAITMIRPGVHIGDIQAIIQETVENAGFSVIRDLTGHGIGQNLQEPPAIPNYGEKGTGFILEKGMVLAIEPMVSAGAWPIEVMTDGWTIRMKDGSLAAHFEHTIAVGDAGAEILTQPLTK